MENLAKIWGLCNEKPGNFLFFLFLILNLINVGPFNGKKSKTNKHRAQVYSGV